MAIFKFSPLGPRYASRPLDELVNWPSFALESGLDVYEQDGSIFVKAAVAGVASKNIEVTYEDGVLTILASTEESEEEKSKNRIVHKKELSTSYSYSTTLPRPIDVNSLSAKVSDGILSIEAKIAPDAQPRKIEVK